MIKYTNINAPLSFDAEWIKRFLAAKLRISQSDITEIKLIKKSVDARKKSDIIFVLSVMAKIKNEAGVLKRNRNNKSVSTVKPKQYTLPKPSAISKRPVIVGFGPAGMFAALYLAECGARPIVLERGLDVDSRIEKVKHFWQNGILDEDCNVQFGEGGAGTFSDGKLNTGVNNPLSRIVFNELVRHGAPDEILYEAKPHIGTDRLSETVRNIREDIISLGGEVIFGAKFTDFTESCGKITSVIYKKNGAEYKIDTDNVILAIGHSARDVFYMLKYKGIDMEAKNFSVGVRIEHTQQELNRCMYGELCKHPALGAADYKLAVHTTDNRGVYTFCMCPGGSVVASSSEKKSIVTNGMSLFARNGTNANSALLVGVTPDDFSDNDVMAGAAFQEKIEKAAYAAAGGEYKAPVCLAGDFLKHKVSYEFKSVQPTYRPGTAFVLPDEYLPEFVCSALRFALPQFGKKIECFNNSDAVLTGPETRSSSPVRILRNESLYALRLRGLYPCGEGAGYAGGIVTAAMDGLKCAMAILGR